MLKTEKHRVYLRICLMNIQYVWVKTCNTMTPTDTCQNASVWWQHGYINLHVTTRGCQMNSSASNTTTDYALKWYQTVLDSNNMLPTEHTKTAAQHRSIQQQWHNLHIQNYRHQIDFLFLKWGRRHLFIVQSTHSQHGWGITLHLCR